MHHRVVEKAKARSFLNGLFDLDPATTYFPTPERCSIIGSSRLNFRVRDGNGCDPADTITGKLVCGGPHGVRAICSKSGYRPYFVRASAKN